MYKTAKWLDEKKIVNRKASVGHSWLNLHYLVSLTSGRRLQLWWVENMKEDIEGLGEEGRLRWRERERGRGV